MKTEFGWVEKYRREPFVWLGLKETHPLTELQHYTQQAEKVAVEYIENQYGSNRFTDRERDKRLYYHSGWHTKGAIYRARKIMESIKKADPQAVSDRDRELAGLAAAFHDLVQISEVDTQQKPDGSGLKPKKRNRLAGRNEEESAAMALSYMDKVNTIAGHSVYTEEDKEKVREAILLTNPKSSEKGQKFEDAGLLAQVVVLADLGGVGMGDRYLATYGMRTLFVEENLDFREEADKFIYQKRRTVFQDFQKHEWYYSRFVTWLADQKGYVDMRKKAVAGEIRQLRANAAAQDSVRELFPKENFDETQEELQRMLNHDFGNKPDFKKWATKLMDSLILPPPFEN